jgi:hypothetical protein
MNIIEHIFRFIGIGKNENEVLKLIENEKESYLNTLKNIEEILKVEGSYEQGRVVEKLAATLMNNEYKKFSKDINSIDMWGGSGAVWEVYFVSKNLKQKFNAEMLELISLMEKTKNLRSGIKPLKKLFKRELSA